MVSPTLVVNGSGSGSPEVTELVLDYDLQGKVTVTAPEEIAVNYDPEKLVTVTVPKKTTICFKGREGKVRVVFVSPFNDNSVRMLDSEERKLTVGGVYHFSCFFIEPDGKEIAGKNGGILDVTPHRP